MWNKMRRRKMKRALSLFIMCILVAILTSCGGPYTISTASMLIVTEKGNSNENEYWIKAYDPNNQTKAEAFKIVVKEKMVWNLIEEDKKYYSRYRKEGDKPWFLKYIEVWNK
jgi:hypothetical protein